MSSNAELTRAIKHALKHAFPAARFWIRHQTIQWTDDGPGVMEVQDALLAAGCGEAEIAWNNTRYIKVAGDTLYFDRFNATERAAYQQDLERRRQEYATRRQREDEAVAQARQAKRAEPLRWQNPPLVQEQSIFEAFEKLRLRAEAEVKVDGDRRPSWAPPLILGELLAQTCLELGYLTLDDKWIGRLWATFATPRRSGQYLREHVSSLPLKGIACRGFQLYAGGSRQSRQKILFEAQRTESGEWQFGPREWPAKYWSQYERDWENLIRERERLGYELEHYTLSEGRRLQVETRLTEIAHLIEAIDAQDAAGANKHRNRQQLRQRVLELARARVLDFIGASLDAQMQLAGKLWGHCCICGKELSDPKSLEIGIGPECLRHKVGYIRALAAEGRRLEIITILTGMPIEFVTAVLSEEMHHV